MIDYLSMASELKWAHTIPQFKTVVDDYDSESPLNQKAITTIRKKTSALLASTAITPVRSAHHSTDISATITIVD